MGPGRAAEIIREAMYRGADNGYLLTDRAFAGADTLATSYALSAAIKQVAPDADLIISGRQAIDGDTAQVGPQVAEKLNLNQITYIEEILSCQNGLIRVKRHIDGGVETVESALPCVLTVNGSAAPCRPRNVRLVMKYKRAMAPIELEQGTGYCDQPYASEYEKKNYLKLGQLNCADIDADLNQCGLAGSPTKVKSVENIVFKAKENKILTGSDEDINSLVKELLASHTIG
jgi:electron transfer flavoprotein beta subunit